MGRTKSLFGDQLGLRRRRLRDFSDSFCTEFSEVRLEGGCTTPSYLLLFCL